MKTLLKHSGLLAAAGLLLSPIAQATTFNFTSGTTTAGQTLGTGSGQTGSIATGATLSVSGSTVAVAVSGNNATLTNLGTIKQTGTGRAIRDNIGVTGLTITNGGLTNSTALMQAADADVIQMNVAGGSVILNNYGTMTSLNASSGGAQAVDFNAITTGVNTINNFSTGVMQATEADAVRPGVNGVVNNAGTILSIATTVSSTDGVDVQQDTGVQINNTGFGLIEGGRHGITGGLSGTNANAAFITSVSNSAVGIIKGDNGSGINLDGFGALQTATIINNGTITGNGVTGDGDGIDVDGLVNITNTGIIRSINAFSTTTPAQSEGITVGGGTIVNSGTIEGLVAAGNINAVGRGISLLGNDITTGPLIGTREAIYGNAIVTNQSGGLIRGDSDSGIAVDGPASGHTVTINNNAGGTIQGGGVTSAAIKTGDDNDTITNSGIINGSSSGKAIDMGAGTNTLNVQGGAASIQGDVSGGAGSSSTLNLNIGTGNNFAYSGALSNFTNVQVNGGTTTLSGSSTYAGPTTVNSGSLLASNSVGSATGSSAVEVLSGASFGGTGSISGPLTVDTGATLSPGLDGVVGILGLGNTVLSAHSIFAIDLNPSNGTADQVNVTGSVALGLSDLAINLLFAPTVGQSFDILTNDGNDLITGIFSQGYFASASFGGQTWNFKIDYAYNADGGAIGNDIRLTAVPVPAAAWLFGTGLLGFVGAARKRKAA
jgi:hypothetical protein